MFVIILTAILSICLAVGFLIAFLISVKHGQFDDQHTPAMRAIQDDVQTRRIFDKANGDGKNMEKTKSGEKLNAG